jgi:hypothetical protein
MICVRYSFFVNEKDEGAVNSEPGITFRSMSIVQIRPDSSHSSCSPLVSRTTAVPERTMLLFQILASLQIAAKDHHTATVFALAFSIQFRFALVYIGHFLGSIDEGMGLSDGSPVIEMAIVSRPLPYK